MKNIVSTNSQFLLSLSSSELTAISNSLSEVLNCSSVTESNCASKIGITHNELKRLHKSVVQITEETDKNDGEIFQVWQDAASIQLRAISAYGDPADLGFDEVNSVLSHFSDKD